MVIVRRGKTLGCAEALPGLQFLDRDSVPIGDRNGGWPRLGYGLGLATGNPLGFFDIQLEDFSHDARSFEAWHRGLGTALNLEKSGITSQRL
jgi:hypothetical protein